MKKCLFILLLLCICFFLSSCESYSTGDTYGGVLILALIIIFIYGIIQSKKEDDMKKDEDERRRKELEESLKKYEEQQEAKRLKCQAEYDAVAEEYKSYYSMDIEVKGIFARSRLAKETVPVLNIYDEIKLRKEPKNQYDPCAVKVMHERIHLGYVPAEDSQFITNLIDHKAIKKVVVKFSGVHQLYPWDKPDPYLTLTLYYTLDGLEEKEPDNS